MSDERVVEGPVTGRFNWRDRKPDDELLLTRADLEMERAEAAQAARAEVIAEIRAGVEGLMKDALRSYDDAVARSLPVLVDRPVEARLWSARMNGLDAVLALLPPTEPKS